MPRQGNTVESCIIGEWKVKEGDNVTAETPVCVVETDKATFEIPAGSAGAVLKILHQAGDDVPVLKPIMVIGEKGETFENSEFGIRNSELRDSGKQHEQITDNNKSDILNSELRDSGKQQEQITDNNKSDIPNSEFRIPNFSISPRARKLANAEAVNPADIGAGSGPGGRIIERDVADFISKRPPLTASAKEELRTRIAAGLPANIDSTAAGTGIGGRVTAAGLGGALKTADRTSRGANGRTGITAGAGIEDKFEDTPIKGIRMIIAHQMMKSHTTTAPFTLNAGTPAVKLQELRSGFKNSDPSFGLTNITINDLILFAVSRTLPLFPYMNAQKNEGAIRTWKNIHLGVAVSTARGLMVPVIRNADSLSLAGISARARELAGACRNGTVASEDLRGSTFTITNLGNTGIESFTPVINIPEVAILGVCSILPKPAETAPGKYEILPTLGFSLTVDHSVVDGAPAAEFLKKLCQTVRDIDMWIIRESV